MCATWPPGRGAVVLLKGLTTVVAEPGGKVLLVNAGSSRLATAGTGDVLSGAIGAFLARGPARREAAALAAHCHGRAASLGGRRVWWPATCRTCCRPGCPRRLAR